MADIENKALGSDTGWAQGLRRHYEAYPYPERDPKDETKRLIQGSPSHILEIDHYLFQGKRDWSQPFSVLVAGGGTGDALIMLAQQLADRHCPARILYVDMSEASLDIAQARATIRGLDHIDFRHGSLFDIQRQDGPFDYIDCCGVLHHLPDPQDGLNHLTSLLHDGSGMGLMVYGTLGRTGVYHMQAMLKHMLASKARSPQDEIALARQLSAALPDTNWFRRNPFIVHHKAQSDANLYDLLLHSQDRSYLVPEFLDLIAHANLEAVSLMEPALYKPETYTQDRKILAETAPMSWQEQAAFAEYFAGNIITHLAYVRPQGRSTSSVASFEDPEAVPIFREPAVGTALQQLRPGQKTQAKRGGTIFSLKPDVLTCDVLKAIDGQRSWGEIKARLLSQPGRLKESRLDNAYRGLMQHLRDFNLVLVTR